MTAFEAIGWTSSLVLLVPALAVAQRPSRFEVSAGVQWSAGTQFSRVDAFETTPDGTRFRLFAAETDEGPARSFTLALTVPGWHHLRPDASFTRGHVDVRSAVSADAESAAPLTATNTITRYTIDGGVRSPWRALRLLGGGTPFLAAGVGYVRQLSEGRTMVAAGFSVVLGGGVDYTLLTRARGQLRTLGLRVDARAARLSSGVALDRAPHTTPSVSASLVVGF